MMFERDKETQSFLKDLDVGPVHSPAAHFACLANGRSLIWPPVLPTRNNAVTGLLFGTSSTIKGWVISIKQLVCVSTTTKMCAPPPLQNTTTKMCEHWSQVHDFWWALWLNVWVPQPERSGLWQQQLEDVRSKGEMKRKFSSLWMCLWSCHRPCGG